MNTEQTRVENRDLAGYTPADIPKVPERLSSKGLEPATRSPGFSWDASGVRHLLRRAAFAPNVEEVNAGVQSDLDTLVNTLLAQRPAPSLLSWVNAPPFAPPLTTEQNQIYSQRRTELREWWIRLMLTQPLSVTEKMTLFWHGHFANEASIVRVPQYLFRQNALFRQYAVGNFKELVKAVAIDPAMLIYLDGVRNRVGNPNENFARELLELFSIGIGNYTQLDIQNAARAFTGWTVPATSLESVFAPSRHDYGTKTFMGQTGNFDGNAIIDIVFQQPATAMFICRKLYKYFVYEVPNETMVDQLAIIFRNSNYEIAPVLQTLLKSAHFFDPLNMGADISGPVERMVGAVRQLGITVNPASDVVSRFIRRQSPALGQELLEPPNVAGWPGYRQWISATTLLLRNAFTDAIVKGRDINNTNIGFKVNPIAFAQLFPNPNNAAGLVDDITAHLLALPVSNSRRAMLLETLLAGIEPYDWNINDPLAGSRIEGLLKVIFRMAEYQLE